MCRFLAKRGADGSLRAVSFGASKPRASNSTAAGRALNRRVEVVVLR